MNDERLNSILGICSSPDLPGPSEVMPAHSTSALMAEGRPIGDLLPIVIGEVMPTTVSESNTAALADKVSAAAPAILPDKQMDELQEDMEYARLNMKDVIDQAKAAFTGALEMADGTAEPRAYEVVSQMIQSIIDANKALISLHKTRKDTLKTDKEVKQTGEATPSEIRIEKAVFIGRAQDLLRSLKEIEKSNVPE
jgi:hypothetical protein